MAEHPDVSIVVTTFNRWDLTRKCLESLVKSARSSALSAEIILSDNCSTDSTPRAWQAFQNDRWPIQYRRNQENLGYLRNANAGAAAARGTYLCLMNNDVIVALGWLDAMVQVLRENADVGLVGPKYVNARGLIVESGCVLFSDASAAQLGGGSLSDDPGFAYVNDVHYCSMACTVVRTDLFRALNGYDERYMPAYYEDADLCMRIVERGFRVVVDPTVRVTHLFGGSHNLDETLQLMDRNRTVFRTRWKERLARLHPPPGTPPARLRSWARGSTIVFHWAFVVNPNSSSGSLRNWLLMLEARRRGHHVVLVGRHDPVDQPYLDTLCKQGIEVRRHRIGAERELVQALVAAHSIGAVVLSFGIVEERYGHLYDECNPDAIRIFDTVDVNFIRELRADQRNESRGTVQRIALGRLPEPAYAEIASMLRSDSVLLVSEDEKEILTRDLHLPAEKFFIVSNIHVAARSIRPFGEREGFSFIGYGGHDPNVDAIEYIVTAIWPGIRQQLPDAQLQVYGFALPQKILALDNSGTGVHIRGFVEDHRAALGASRVMLAPLRFGSGVKGKIGESLAVGTPVVTTPVGAEGMDALGHALVVETDAERLARRAVEVYRDEEEWNRRSQKGLELLQQRFSAATAGDSLIESIAAGRRMRVDGTAWKHIAYAAMAQQKMQEKPRDLALRMGRRVTELIYKAYRLTSIQLRPRPVGPARTAHVGGNTEARLNAIKSKPVRLLAKSIYYMVTLQLFSRLRDRRPRSRVALLQVAPLAYELGAGAVQFGDERTAAKPWLEVSPSRSRAEYERELAQPVWQARARVEHLLAYDHRKEAEFFVPGFSVLAGRPVDFLVDRLYGAELRDGLTIPRWRERLVCPVTQLTNRQRAMVLFLREYGARVAQREKRAPDVFMFEQVTPLYRYLQAAAQAWKITGCEWLGPDVKPGAVVNGIRHENCAALSLADSSVDIVMSLDVFEHVPDPRRGFREKARVLRPGGVLLMTVPFFPERDATVQRARFESGNLKHLLPPEYHGNPVDPDGGSLVYHDFGWDLLPMIREGGFSDAFVGLYWSLEYGHLGAPQIVFVATK